jgi:hypothetical protein
MPSSIADALEPWWEERVRVASHVAANSVARRKIAG